MRQEGQALEVWQGNPPPLELFFCSRSSVLRPPVQWGKHRDVVTTDSAPAAIGPYSQAIRVGSKLCTLEQAASAGFFLLMLTVGFPADVSGQIAMDAKTKTLVGSTIAEQTTKTLQNLQAVVEAGGSSLANVVKVCVCPHAPLAFFLALHLDRHASRQLRSLLLSLRLTRGAACCVLPCLTGLDLIFGCLS